MPDNSIIPETCRVFQHLDKNCRLFGKVVTYYWYRFASQPAILNAAERKALQARVEKLHRHWKKDRDYLPPPTLGTLSEIEPALIVTPPEGLEAGYVPIVTRQEVAK